MEYFIWLGILLGASLGTIHSIQLYREISARDANFGATANGFNIRGLYYALWTFGLWCLFGSYVLALWLMGLIAKALHRILRGSGEI